jgi:hypothetical protein
MEALQAEMDGQEDVQKQEEDDGLPFASLFPPMQDASHPYARCIFRPIQHPSHLSPFSPVSFTSFPSSPLSPCLLPKSPMSFPCLFGTCGC